MPPPPAAPQYAYAYAPAYQPPPPPVFIPPPVEQTPPPQPCVPKFPLPQCYLGKFYARKWNFKIVKNLKLTKIFQVLADLCVVTVNWNRL